MGALRNIRHERFVRAYVRLNLEGIPSGHVWRAYKEAYPHVTQSVCLRNAGSRLLQEPHIQKRIKEVTKRLITRAEITEERILGKYEDAYDLADRKSVV